MMRRKWLFLMLFLGLVTGLSLGCAQTKEPEPTPTPSPSPTATTPEPTSYSQVGKNVLGEDDSEQEKEDMEWEDITPDQQAFFTTIAQGDPGNPVVGLWRSASGHDVKSPIYYGFNPDGTFLLVYTTYLYPSGEKTGRYEVQDDRIITTFDESGETESHRFEMRGNYMVMPDQPTYPAPGQPRADEYKFERVSSPEGVMRTYLWRERAKIMRQHEDQNSSQ